MIGDNIWVEKEAESPNFDYRGKRVHDWQTYVSEELQEMWFDIDLKVRCAIIRSCQEQADAEHWD